MSRPRRVVPGASYLFTRRCLERRFFLRPSEEVNQIVLYCMALAAGRHGILIHAYCAMSNHVHLVLTDPGARLPAFAQLMDAMIARAMNKVLGRWGYFWEAYTYSAVQLLGEWQLLDKSAYVLCNPVNAGLVRRGAEWPGAWSDPAAAGGPPLWIRLPAAFQDPLCLLPAAVPLRLSPPLGMHAADFRRQLLRLTDHVEAEKAAQLAAQGRRVAGRARVLAQSPEASSMSVEQRKKHALLFASHDKWKRLEMARQHKAFEEEHRDAFRSYQRGDHRACFPFGTYWMRVILHARCLDPG